MAKYLINHVVEESGVRFYLTRKPLIGAAELVAIDRWSDFLRQSNLVAGMTLMLAWADDEDCESDEQSLLVPNAIVAGLTGLQASSVSLPDPVPFVLNVENRGTIDQHDFYLRAYWAQPGGGPILGATRTGAILRVGSSAYRIPATLYAIVEQLEGLGGVPRDERFRRWSVFQEILDAAEGPRVNTTGYVRTIKFAHASGFSLRIQSGADGFTFDPVLFGAKITERTFGEDEGQTAEVTEAQKLLPEKFDEVFVKERFEAGDGCNSSYALGDGWYVVLDEEVRKALEIVKKARQGDEQSRKDFAKNPRAYVREEFGDSLPEDRLERLFVETSEFSERVRDVGLWEPVVIPWIQRTADTWIPEACGLRLGDEHVTIRLDDITPLKEKVKEAIAAGQLAIDHQGFQIPANQDTLTALEGLVGVQTPGKQDIGTPDGGETPERKVPVVLLIDQNFEAVEYTRSRTPRGALGQYGLPSSLRTSFKEHQAQGFDWMVRAWADGLPGVLLADDMGLGKTIQGLAFLSWMRERIRSGQVRRGPVLIVAPVALLQNWQEEYQKHFDAPNNEEWLIAYGAALRAIRKGVGNDTIAGRGLLQTERIQEADWVLTTYETLRDYQHSFGSIRFNAIVYDEIQKVKTPGTIMTRAAKAMNGDFVLALTGTPVENRLADLWCVMDTVQPGLLGDLKAFSQRYEANAKQETLRELKGRLMQGGWKTSAPMLRRMKADQLDGLPNKVEHTIKVEMPKEQANAYTQIIAQTRGAEQQGAMLKALHAFRAISLHPVHPDQATEWEYISQSARLKALFDILDGISEKREKALIFLESRDAQPVVASIILRRYGLERLPLLINGAVSGAKRQDRVNQFQAAARGFDVMILSPRAGGVGLTLTAANHVIHLSRWWNPAVEDQCTDRVYRIGQEREVHVYHPLAVHPEVGESSFDVLLHNLLERKRSLSRQMLMPPVDVTSDTEYLFSSAMGDGSVVHDEEWSSFSLNDIDVMEPSAFERWVLDRLRQAGYSVNLTPRSHDHGADGVARHPGTGQTIVVQCKHIQRDGLCDQTAVDDLIRAKGRYALDNAFYVAVTNGRGFNSAAMDLARASGIVLVSRADLAEWPLSLLPQ